MAPVVELTPETFSRLQKLAIPLVDTIETVINKLLDERDKSQGTSPPFQRKAKEYGAGPYPDLSFTKVLSIELFGELLKTAETNWNALLDRVICLVAKEVKDIPTLQEYIIVNHVVGKKEDQGYRYLPQAGISVQGQDANSAWKGAVHLIKAMNIPLRLVFAWYDNIKASNPGQTGKITLHMDVLGR